VPCGPCNACCKSSCFIHIAPTETETLRSIPAELLFPAPSHPEGFLLLGFDAHGQCPLLIDERCSIYAQRPQTCRTYDCRIFSAAGIAAGDEDKAGINRQLKRWSFAYPDPQDARQHAAVRNAAVFLQSHTDNFPAGFVPSNNTQLAVLALRVYAEFADYDTAEVDDPTRTSRLIAAVIAADAAFEQAR